MAERTPAPNKVIARYLHARPKYFYVVYRVLESGEFGRVEGYWSKWRAKRAARLYANARELWGIEYVVIREER